MSGKQEIPDQTPVEWPPHIKAPETLAQQIQRLVRVEVSRVAEQAGLETFDEADDFDVDDDSELYSEHELSDEQELRDRRELTRERSRGRISNAQLERDDLEREEHGGANVDVEARVVDNRAGAGGVSRRPAASTESRGSAGGEGSRGRGTGGDSEPER